LEDALGVLFVNPAEAKDGSAAMLLYALARVYVLLGRAQEGS
jgi:hypothetical protein